MVVGLSPCGHEAHVFCAENRVTCDAAHVCAWIFFFAIFLAPGFFCYFLARFAISEKIFTMTVFLSKPPQ
jgi:hypothetical protein